ncbi:MAG: glycosyltransferase family 2 protein [Massilibacteroides sp.]|nr:glycosyltransferase family 2 protein [Massilibacteroides sp.]
MKARKTTPLLAVVVPCYNEQEVLPLSHAVLLAELNRLKAIGKISAQSFLLYVNDGSTDTTWSLIESFYVEEQSVSGLNLALNVGHQKALLAGLLKANAYAEVLISIDADLQDDIACFEAMVDRYGEGYDIVYGVRQDRKTDTFFKKNSALAFYKLMNWLGAESVYNHADYRLMSQRAVRQLGCYRERNLFLRGIVPLIGYHTTSVFYSRSDRRAGETHYPLSKMLNFAIDGITSFSIRPLRFITGLGFVFFLVSLAEVFYVVWRWSVGRTVEGWASLMISVWFLSSLILISLGIVGEYIGRMYIEVKDRPRYNIESFLKHEDN